MRRRSGLILLALTLVLGHGAATPGRAAGATQLLPNLKMAHLRDIAVSVENGRRLLRFTTTMLNLGSGRFETRGSRSTTAESTLKISQRVFDDAGGSVYYPTSAIARYSGDGHDHWHVQDVMTYELWNEAAPTTVRRGAKHGFCFFDTTPWAPNLPNAAQSSYYRQEWCGTRAVLTNRTGISVGWGDRYPANFAYQWIDITGMPAGTYMLRTTVDQQNYYRETVESDNCVWVRITIPASGGTVGVAARGSDCGADSVRAVDSFPGGTAYSTPRRLVFEAGTYGGYRFNSAGTVLGSKTATLSSPSGASTTHRAIPPGQSSNWLYIVNGIWAGYWIKDTPRIDFAN